MRWVAGAAFALALAIGTGVDPSPRGPLERRGPYVVLEGDFHMHTRMSDGFLSPFDLVLAARRQGLDVIGVTEHNMVVPAKIARAFSRLFDRPRVLVGEEITSRDFHLIAVGLTHAVSGRLPLDQAIREIHAQGGLAIAAHPVHRFWEIFTRSAAELDGMEVIHPIAFRDPVRPDGGKQPQADGPRATWRAHDLIEFYEQLRRAGHKVAAIGSSDYHFFKVLGACRTFIFATGDDEASIMDALRAGRTVVYDLAGKAYGDPALIALVQDAPLRSRAEPGYAASSPLDAAGRALGWIALVALLLFGGEKRSAPRLGAKAKLGEERVEIRRNGRDGLDPTPADRVVEGQPVRVERRPVE